MCASHNRATIRIDAEPADVFGFITDLDSLPHWNAEIVEVLERPGRLHPGAVWKVAMQQGPMRWVSRSTIVEHDPGRSVFTYRSGTDDANPSYAEWRWEVSADEDGAVLAVTWSLHPLTGLRRWVLAPYRARRLRAAVPASLARMAAALDAAKAGTEVNAVSGPRPPGVLLAVWAHPDDESYLAGALMHLVRRSGGRVVVVTATHGELGLDLPAPQVARIREAELRGALAALGVDELHLLGLPDGGCADADPSDVTDRLTDLIRAVNPDVVVTFGPDGITGHSDHVAVSQWTTAAWQRAGVGQLLYATLTHEFAAQHRGLHELIDLFVDGEAVTIPEAAADLHVRPDAVALAAKRAALAAHASQTRPIIDRLGASAFYGWYVDETFREPTPEELARPGGTPASARRWGT